MRLPPECQHLLDQKHLQVELRDHLDGELAAYFSAYYSQKYFTDSFRTMSQEERAGRKPLHATQETIKKFSLIKYIHSKSTSAVSDEYSVPGSCVCLVLRCAVTQVALGMAILTPSNSSVAPCVSQYCIQHTVSLATYWKVDYLCTISSVFNFKYHQTTGLEKNYWGDQAGTILLCLIYYFTTQMPGIEAGFYLQSSTNAIEFYVRSGLQRIEPSPTESLTAFITPKMEIYSARIDAVIRALITSSARISDLLPGVPVLPKNFTSAVLELQRRGRLYLDLKKR